MYNQSMYTTYALECTGHFLGEKRAEPYREYGEGVSQMKNALGAKNDLQERALLDLEGVVPRLS